jgi:hypothetical protein
MGRRGWKLKADIALSDACLLSVCSALSSLCLGVRTWLRNVMALGAFISLCAPWYQ